MVSRAKVAAALRTEAKKLNSRHRGVHIFDAIHRTEDVGCNWSTNYHCRGSNVPLDEMQEAIDRVQGRMPLVDFED